MHLPLENTKLFSAEGIEQVIKLQATTIDDLIFGMFDPVAFTESRNNFSLLVKESTSDWNIPLQINCDTYNFGLDSYEKLYDYLPDLDKKNQFEQYKPEILRAMILGRYSLSTFKHDRYLDRKRRYSDAKAYSHVHGVANLAGYMSLDPFVYILALSHDTVEDFPPIENLNKKIKNMVREGASRDDLENLISEYNGLVNSTLKKIADCVFIEDSQEKEEYIIGLRALTHHPWETYEQYIERIFQVENPKLRNALITIKLADKLHNMLTDFNYEKNSHFLLKRIESFREVQMLLDRTVMFLNKEIGNYLISKRKISEEDHKFFQEYPKRPKLMSDSGEQDQERSDNEAQDTEYNLYSKILSHFENVNLVELSKKEKYRYLDAIYSIHAQLSQAIYKDSKDIGKYLQDGFVDTVVGVVDTGFYQKTGREEKARRAKLRKKAKELKKSIKSEVEVMYNMMIDYDQLNGFSIRTREDMDWGDGKKWPFDNFLTKIDKRIQEGNFVVDYSKLSDEDKLTLINEMLKDFLPFEFKALHYLGKTMRSKVDYEHVPGLALVSVGPSEDIIQQYGLT